MATVTKVHSEESIAEITAQIEAHTQAIRELETKRSTMRSENYAAERAAEKKSASTYSKPRHEALEKLATADAQLTVSRNSVSGKYTIKQPSLGAFHGTSSIRETIYEALSTAGYLTKVQNLHPVSGYYSYVISDCGRDQLKAWNEKHTLKTTK